MTGPGPKWQMIRLSSKERRELSRIHDSLRENLALAAKLLAESLGMDGDLSVTTLGIERISEGHTHLKMGTGLGEQLCYCDSPGTCIPCEDLSGGVTCKDLYPETGLSESR